MVGFLNVFKRKMKKPTINRDNIDNVSNKNLSTKRLNNESKQFLDIAVHPPRNKLIDRHFYYNNAIEHYYKLRDKEEGALDKCVKLCKEDIEISSEVLRLMKNNRTFKHYDESGKLIFTPPHFPSFKKLAIIYDKQERYEEAIEVCKIAMQYNLKDGTKGGFEGRITRLKNKLNKKRAD